jgi:hypothetical protein
MINIEKLHILATLTATMRLSANATSRRPALSADMSYRKIAAGLQTPVILSAAYVFLSLYGRVPVIYKDVSTTDADAVLCIPVFTNTNGPFYLIPDANGPIYLNVYPAIINGCVTPGGET